MRQVWPDAKWILDPYYIYNTIYASSWVNQIKDRADKDELTPDMLTQEAPSTKFVDEVLNFNSGVNITKDRVGITQLIAAGKTEANNRLFCRQSRH